MEERYNHIIEKLNSKKHEAPDLIKIWQYYLTIKKQTFMESLQKCEYMLEHTNDLPQIDKNTLLILYLLNKYHII